MEKNIVTLLVLAAVFVGFILYFKYKFIIGVKFYCLHTCSYLKNFIKKTGFVKKKKVERRFMGRSPPLNSTHSSHLTNYFKIKEKKYLIKIKNQKKQ